MTRRQNRDENRAEGFYFKVVVFYFLLLGFSADELRHAHACVCVALGCAHRGVCARAWVLRRSLGKWLVCRGGLQGRTTSRTNFATEEGPRAPSLFNGCTERLERSAGTSQSEHRKGDSAGLVWVKKGEIEGH